MFVFRFPLDPTFERLEDLLLSFETVSHEMVPPTCALSVICSPTAVARTKQIFTLRLIRLATVFIVSMVQEASSAEQISVREVMVSERRSGVQESCHPQAPILRSETNAIDSSWTSTMGGNAMDQQIIYSIPKKRWVFLEL